MRKILLLLVASIVLLQNHAKSETAKADTTAPRILIINAFDASALKARKNKVELFAELADSLKQYLHTELSRSAKVETIVAKELMNDATGHTLSSLLQQYNCTRAVVITKLNVWFERKDIEVTKNDDGSKSREATYDICSDVQYIYHSDVTTAIVFDKNKCDFFTKRNTTSGLLATGPDIVGKSKHAFIAIRQNAAIAGDELLYNVEKRK